MKAVFFPKNNLTVNVCRCFNGHIAPITFNTDRLKDGKYALAELESFRNDVQLTSFLNPRYDFFSENVNYGETLKKLNATGRWSWGLYFNTNAWLNPFTGVVENIPGYGQSTWSPQVADFYNSHGASIVSGTTKTANYPNHGGNLYALTNGHMGYDLVSGSWGSETNGSETIDWLDYQLGVFIDLFGKRVTSMSYMNGVLGNIPVMTIPYMLGGRNSNYSSSGESYIKYDDLLRFPNTNRPSNTRAWDAHRVGQFPTQQEAIDYTKQQIQYAIDNGGFFTDFAHIHSFYELNDLPFIGLFFGQVRDQIDSQDVWNCGYAEAMEYAFIRDSVDKFGSFEYNNELFFFYKIKDKYKGTSYGGVPNDLDYSILNTPLSFEIDTTGTSLEGKDIKCDEAVLIRKLGSNKWIVSVPYRLNEEGYARFGLYEGTSEYYSSVRPIISHSGNTITTDIPSKVVVWRKPTSGGLSDIVEDSRYNDISSSHTHIFEGGYDYYIGAITRFNHSSLIEI